MNLGIATKPARIYTYGESRAPVSHGQKWGIEGELTSVRSPSRAPSSTQAGLTGSVFPQMSLMSSVRMTSWPPLLLGGELLEQEKDNTGAAGGKAVFLSGSESVFEEQGKEVVLWVRKELGMP